MDLHREILKEHSRSQCLKIVDFVGVNPTRFQQLVNVFLEGPYRITQRSAWPLSVCVEQHPALAEPHLGKLIRFLKTPGIHNAVKRNVLRLLTFITIPKKHFAVLIELCFNYLQQKDEAVAVKVFAMEILSEIGAHHPELLHELKVIIEDQMPYATPGFRSKGMKVLKRIQS